MLKNEFFTRRGLFIAGCLVLNWSRRHAFIYATKMWNLWGVLQFLKSFRVKYIVTHILQEMENGLSPREQQLQVIMYYISIWAQPAAISSLADKINAPRKKGTMLLLSSTLKDTKIFPNLLFWSDSWVTAPVFHNRFFIINLYLMTVVIHSNREWPSLYKSNWRCLFTFKAC